MKSRSGLLARACLQALQLRSMVVATAATAALLGSVSVLAEDRFGREVEFDIPSQSLEMALLEFSRQADVQVMVGSTALAGLTSPQVKGRLPVVRALDALLQKSGLAYETHSNTVTLRRIIASTSPPPVLRLGEAPAGAAGEEPVIAASDGASAPPPESSRTVEMLDEVIVTGSHIRGEASAGSHVQVLELGDIDASGYGTVQDVLNTVPQNYGGGAAEDFNTALGNFNRGVGVNLRGLGSDATLVLVNGRRQALSGTEGNFVDISSIPTSAVERIEVLSDGASAIYGSDAIGGVVNIVLRDRYDGAETRARIGSADGTEEWSVSQVFGKSWTTGHALIGYQYNERDELARADRDYTSSADQRRYGGDDFRSTFSNPGNILDPSTFQPAFGVPAGQDGRSLTPADLLPGVANAGDPFGGGDLFPHQRLQAAFLNVDQQLGDRLSVSLDARYAERRMDLRILGLPAFLVVPASNAFYVNAFGDGAPLLMSYSMLDDLGAITADGQTDTVSGTLGLALELAQGWRLQTSGSYSEEALKWRGANIYDADALQAALADSDPATAFNPFADGSGTNPATIDGLRDEQHEGSRAAASSFNAIADGPLFDLPGGPAKLAVGIDYRDETLKSGAVTRVDLSRDVFAGFAEVALPLLAGSSTRGEPALEMSLAARYEDYSDFGTTLDPKVGLSWMPHPAVRARATWGTSFKAPRLIDINESPASTYAQLTAYPDPQSPFGQSIVLARFGKNAELQEETATIWTAGLDFRFGDDSAPSLSLTYFDIDYQDRIAEGGPPADLSSILLHEDQWAEVIQRNPSAADVAALCNGPQFIGDPASCVATPPAAIIDQRLRNFGALRVQGIDLMLSGETPLSWGDLGASFNGTHLLEYERFATDQSPGFDVVDTVGNPPALRLRGSVSWRLQGWSANAFVNYMGSYTDDLSVPHRRVGSWTTADLRFAYRTRDDASWLSGTEVALSATNVLDEPPPFVNSQHGYDFVNADLMGRVISAQLSKAW